MYPPHHLGGYELTWRSSVRHLRRQGHEVRVLTTDHRSADPDPAIGEDPDAHRVLRWYWRDHAFPALSPLARLRIERHNAAALERQIAGFRPDAVAWWAMGGMSLGLIERARGLGLPAVGVVGDDWMTYGPQVDAWQRGLRRTGPLAGAIARLTGLPATTDRSPVLWLFNSRATRRRALGAGQALPRTEVVHPGIDDRLFTPAPAHAWGWRLLVVGRIDERKGIDTAIGSLAHLPGQARLRIVGAGDPAAVADLRALAQRLGVAERVELGVTVPRSELRAAYAEADVLLFPTVWDEPWGLVPLEAMAVGTAVVATGTGGSREYLADTDNALVIGAGAGPGDLAAAVRRLAGDAGLRERMRTGGRATAARYPESAYNEAIERALRSCGREARSGGPTSLREPSA